MANEDVAPVLDELFKHAEKKEALWLKGKDCLTLAKWIISLQNIATLYEKQLAVIVEDQVKVKKKKLWRPGL